MYLSLTRKKILINSMLQAITSYVMSVFLLPEILGDEITSILRGKRYLFEEIGKIYVKLN